MTLAIKHKIFAALFLIGFVAVSGTSYIGYSRSKSALQQSIFNHLTSIREANADQITGYFNRISNEVKILAASRMATEATKAFLAGIREMDLLPSDPKSDARLADFYQENWLPKLSKSLGSKLILTDFLPTENSAKILQTRYIVDNHFPPDRRQLLDRTEDESSYNDAHAIFHPLLRQFTNTLGFYDLLIINPENGQMIYSVMKEPDFGTDLFRGAYRNSNLTTAVTNCLASSANAVVCPVDFASYMPSLGVPSAFLAVPVIDQGKTLAIFALQISIDEINRVMTANRGWQRVGLGNTGETYLVGPDFQLRSDSRFFIDDREQYFKALSTTNVAPERIAAIHRNKTSILQQEVRTKASEMALGGLEGTQFLIDYRGEPVLSSYRLISVAGMSWAIIAEIDLAEAFAPIAALRLQLILISASLMLVVFLGSLWLSGVLLGPIRTLTDGAVRMSRGERSIILPVTSRDELGRLTEVFNDMFSQVQEQTRIIEKKNIDNEKLLLNILPRPIADRLREGAENISDHFPDVTVLFADIVGFTQISAHLQAAVLVDLLNDLFVRFDAAAQEIGIEKIKTIGDSYMAACGVTNQHEDHAARMVKMAVRLIHICREYSLERKISIRLRIGINTGPVVAGVIGTNKFIYDLWGDTVNMASRMESEGIVDTIQVTNSVYENLKDLFPFTSRGLITVPGKGEQETWTLKI